jgi:hypothetical protein
MPSELLHYELRPARKPWDSDPIASLALVTEPDGRTETCYIRFSEKFVRAVGQALPRGVSLFDPAYVHVYAMGDGTWTVWALYFDGSGVVLWKSDTKPTWLNNRERNHDTRQTVKNPRSSAAPRAASQAGLCAA